MSPRFRWIEPCVYEVGNTGYRVEMMADGSWEAYLPDAWGFRLWQSVKHSKREGAAMAVSAERRRVRAAVAKATS